MASREEVEWAYRLFYGREPEADLAVATKLHLSRPDLVKAILSSEEFKARHLSSTVPDRWLWCDCFGYQLKINLKDEHVSRRIVENEYETAETAYIQNTVLEGQQCVDLGCNLGYYALLMARLVEPTGRVIGVEPDPALFEALTSTVKHNRLGGTIKLHKAAVSDSVGRARLIPPMDETNWGQSYIKQPATRPGRHEARSVRTITLDTLRLSRRIDFIKMDIEGAEALALKSSQPLLAATHPTMLLEINPMMLEKVSDATVSDCFDLLGEIGYQIFALGEDGKLARRLQASDISGIQNVVALGPDAVSKSVAS